MKKAQIILFSTTLVAMSVYEYKRDIRPQRTEVAKVKVKTEKKIAKSLKKGLKKS